MFDQILRLSHHFISTKNESYRRYFIRTKRLSNRLSIITGQRGIGKTVTLIQYLLEHVGGDPFDKRILYIQADHFTMQQTTLYELAEYFRARGVELIAIDEIHKYPQWSRELKSIYDTFPQLRIIASGSSALEIVKGSHDLSRRALLYSMQGMSFRELPRNRA